MFTLEEKQCAFMQRSEAQLVAASDRAGSCPAFAAGLLSGLGEERGWGWKLACALPALPFRTWTQTFAMK